MNIAIVDDDPEQLTHLCEKIESEWKKWENTFSITSFTNILDIYDTVREYDLVFMDIKMPQKDGITAAEELHQLAPDLMIIFISDFDSYVWNSFQALPVSFIRKSYLDDELSKVIKQCFEIYARNHQIFSINSAGNIYRYPIQDIYYIEAQRKNICIKLQNEEQLICTTLSNAEERLKNMRFLKIHRAYLVNHAHIRSFERSDVILDNNERLPMSKYRYKEIYEQYLQYLMQ